MGTLCFEKLRSSGYFHSFFLLKEQLSPEQLKRELQTMNWFTVFGACYQLPSHAGEVADNLRALAIPKLIYALSQNDKQEREVALTAFKHYMDNALGIAPGFSGRSKLTSPDIITEVLIIVRITLMHFMQVHSLLIYCTILLMHCPKQHCII